MNPLKIRNDYMEWYSEGVDAVFANGNGSFWSQITVPLLDRHNDHIQVCIAHDEEAGVFVFTDDGDSATEIGLTGWALDDDRFLRALGNICRAHDVFFADNEVQTKCTDAAQIPERIQALAQAILEINCLWILAPIEVA